MSHVLDMTGAPIVLVSAVPVLRSVGYEVLVLGPSDGGSLHLFLDAGASVITRSSCRNVSDAWGMALCADFVIANTVVMARAVRALSGTAVPVLWWLHDAFAGYPHTLPTRSPPSWENVRGLLGGQPCRQRHARRAARVRDPAAHLRPARLTRQKTSRSTDLGYANGRPLFVATVGSFERRKGQDIFCKRPNADHGGKRADRKSGTVEQQITLKGQADACPFYHIAVFAKKNFVSCSQKPAGICYTVLKSR